VPVVDVADTARAVLPPLPLRRVLPRPLIGVHELHQLLHLPGVRGPRRLARPRRHEEVAVSRLLRTIVVGRDPMCAFVIPDDEYLSPRHAVLRQYDDGRVTIEDLGSVNGTFVNGRRVYVITELHTGDRVRIGRTTATIPGGPP
jgi:hypothetical protein